MLKRSILIVAFLVVTLTLAGCGKGKARYGEAIPNNVEVVKLKVILENPDAYKGKEVVLEGNFGGVCCPSSFNYKEGLEMVEVYPQGFSNPKLDRGKPIRVYGVVRSIEKKVESKKGEKEEQHKIHIEGKGVETK